MCSSVSSKNNKGSSTFSSYLINLKNITPQREILENKLETLLSKLKPTKLINEFLPLLPNVLWANVKKKLEKRKLPVNYAGKVIVQTLLKEKDDATFDKIANRAFLLDTVLKKTLKWNTWLMYDKKTSSTTVDLAKLEKQVLQSIRIKKLNADLYTIERDDIFYFMVKMRKLRKNRGVQLSQPLIFAVSKENMPYVFVMNSLPKDKIKIFVAGNGYDNFKSGELSGKSVAALISILKRKCDPNDLPVEIPFQPEIIKTSSSDICLQNRGRLTYASQHFDENTPCIEELVVHGAPEYQGRADFEGEFRTCMKIKSKNMADTMRLFAQMGIIQPPFPNYIQKFLKLGRNNLKLKSTQSE
ncbi:uncharacterized protein LOC111045442 isoform X2 [Nilaparvata lugens]|nr:uncharacterized protein LOC111045442 isoform X2 [Nilaparvata lugens]XP_039276602.1 uncharacterized protein LOC111045442 isoform X2 [Nilaparvata lugens]